MNKSIFFLKSIPLLRVGIRLFSMSTWHIHSYHKSYHALEKCEIMMSFSGTHKQLFHFENIYHNWFHEEIKF